LLEGRERVAVERTIAPRMIAGQRWFAAKGQRIEATRVLDYGLMNDRAGTEAFILPLAEIRLAGGETQTYFLPVAIDESAEDESRLNEALARVRRGRRTGLIFGAARSPEFVLSVLDAMRAGTEIPTGERATLRFAATSLFPSDVQIDPGTVRRLSGEQSNTSIALDDSMVLKLYRRVQPGIHPEVEVGRFLTEVAGFANTPPTLGTVEHLAADGTPSALAILQSFVRNQGDAWRLTLDQLTRELDTFALTPTPDEVEGEQGGIADVFAPYRRYAEILGQRTGEMHRAFATPTDDPAFVVEPLTESDVRVAAEDARDQAERAFAAIRRMGDLSGTAREAIEAFTQQRDRCLAVIDALAVAPSGAVKTRIHGDYHLGQVLIVQDDVMIVDFEGEPSRPAEERRAKSSPLRDVAGMLRSFAYAADSATREVGTRLPESGQRIAGIAADWLRLTEEAFLVAYEQAVVGSPVWVADDAARARLMRLHLLGKALYEVNYEANNRPDWIETPIRGVLSILAQGTE
ncbi:MAG TPA: putative maltokinase, partial [Enterovirga sp.]|nr:putative maltokinase [Enterovirga sp.]